MAGAQLVEQALEPVDLLEEGTHMAGAQPRLQAVQPPDDHPAAGASSHRPANTVTPDALARATALPGSNA